MKDKSAQKDARLRRLLQAVEDAETLSELDLAEAKLAAYKQHA